MSEKTGIEWTEATWNPTTGCDRVSPGCAKCYAKTLHDKRHQAFMDGWTEAPAQYHQPFEIVQVHDDRLDAPLHWRKPRKVFVNSVSDLFYGDEADRLRCERAGRPFTPVPDAFIDRVFAVMALASQHTFQILTKRAERMREYFTVKAPEDLLTRWADAALTIKPLGNGENATDEAASRYEDVFSQDWPLPNVWLGVSVENQHFADKRIPLLLETPAAVRFISAEPLLERVTFKREWLGQGSLCADCGLMVSVDEDGCCASCGRDAIGLDWVIDGAESGHGARDYRIAWSLALQRQCEAAGVAYFRKQVGHRPIVDDLTHWRGSAELLPDSSGYRLTLRDKKGGDPAEWPEDLRIREFPTEVRHVD